MSNDKHVETIKYLLKEKGGHYFKGLDETYRNNPEIALHAIKHNPNLSIMEKANDVIRDNKAIALLELKSNARAIGFLSERLRGDKEVALLACKYFGSGLSHVSNELKNDEDVVSLAVENDPFSIFEANPNMLNNERVLNIALKKYKLHEKFFDSINEKEHVEFIKQYEKKYELNQKLKALLPKSKSHDKQVRKMKL